MAVDSNDHDTPMQEMTQENINAYMIVGYEVGDNIDPSPENKEIFRCDTY